MRNFVRITVFSAALIAALSLLSVVAPAQTGRTKRVRFASGKSSITLKGAIVRGTADRYVVGARRGQMMSVKISSIERNANFTVYFAGEQESLVGSDEATEWTGKLSDDNDYVIVVGSRRGNAAYTLTITIK
jgi:hypothetical protein